MNNSELIYRRSKKSIPPILQYNIQNGKQKNHIVNQHHGIEIGCMRGRDTECSYNYISYNVIVQAMIY